MPYAVPYQVNQRVLHLVKNPLFDLNVGPVYGECHLFVFSARQFRGHACQHLPHYRELEHKDFFGA